MSGTYYLNRERFRVVERNDRGNVVYRKMYKFKDEVDVSHIDETHVENLVASGALVQSKDDLTGWTGPRGPYPGSQAVGAAGVSAADHSEIDDPGASPEEKKAASGSVDDDDPEDVDQFSSMDYAELQAAAKAADIPANQSAEDLRAALRAGDES